MSRPISNQEISLALEQAAALMDVAGANPHRIRAYRKAAEVVRGRSDRVADLAVTGTLTRLDGVGAGLQTQIQGLVQTGRLEALDAASREVPLSVLGLLALPGLGPKKVAALWQKLHISTVDELHRALDSERINDLRGFGPKNRKRLAEAVAFARSCRGKMLLPEAFDLAEELKASAERLGGTDRVEVAGAVRRRCELIDEIVLVVQTTDPAEAVFERLKQTEPYRRALGSEPSHPARARPSAVRVHAAAGPSFASALVHATGSPAHLEELKTRACELGLAWGPAMPAGSEEAFYEALGLPFIPPELREGRGEVLAAAAGGLGDLVRARDLKGLLHVHSDWSDGSMTLEDLARKGAEHGFEYVGVADHGPAAAYAGGLTAARLLRQLAEIRAVNRKGAGAVLLSGVEADILDDGSLDVPDTVLRKLDFVVASVHSRLRMSEERMTGRILSALRNPRTTILGHPSGRLLLDRPAYPVDLEAVLGECGRLGKAVEMNAHPQRLDLPWEWGVRVRQLGLKVALDPDAHHPPGFEHVQRYGIWMARKAWLTPKDVLNCMGLEQLRHEGWIRT